MTCYKEEPSSGCGAELVTTVDRDSSDMGCSCSSGFFKSTDILAALLPLAFAYLEFGLDEEVVDDLEFFYFLCFLMCFLWLDFSCECFIM